MLVYIYSLIFLRLYFQKKNERGQETEEEDEKEDENDEGEKGWEFIGREEIFNIGQKRNK